jgi:uncharacterized membrane protein YfcA
VSEFYALLLFGLGLIGGALSGLIGIGGGIIMVPLLLYVPPLAGLPMLGMKAVAGMTTVQSFTGGLFGAIGHNKFKRVSLPLATSVGIPMAITGFVTSRLSARAPESWLLVTFAGMAAFAGLLMFLLRRRGEPEETSEPVFSRPHAIGLGCIIGALSGFIGQGGAFLYIPAMLVLLMLPTRVTIGSALAVGVMSSTGVLIGRLGTGQIPWQETLFLVGGVIVGARLGSVISQRIPHRDLHGLLTLIIVGTTVKIGYDLLVS